MRDIVATIQPDQDDIVRADAAQTVCVQGAPGTGKTAVGLHRVAYLLYAYREQVRRRGVVMIGPNQAFLSYIRNVLPALGELDVAQTTVGELVKSLGPVPVRGSDADATAVVKGDARMAEVLRRALWSSVRRPSEAVVLARGARRWRVAAYELEELTHELRHRGRAVRRGPRAARAPDRARDPDPDGGGRGGLRRPHARGGAAVPAGAFGGRGDLAEGGSGPAGVRAPVVRRTAGRGGRRTSSRRTSRPRSCGRRCPARRGRRAGRRPTRCSSTRRAT